MNNSLPSRNLPYFEIDKMPMSSLMDYIELLEHHLGLGGHINRNHLETCRDMLDEKRSDQWTPCQ